MKTHFKNLLIASRSLLLVVIYSPALISFAANAGSYTVKNPLGPQGASFCTLLKAVLNAAMILGVPVAVLAIVYAGFKFVAARGNDEGISKARANFFYTILGIAIFFGAGVIANVIIGTLQSIGVQGVSSC